MNKWIILLLIPFSLASCIGTDVLEAEVFTERVQITTLADTIKVGESFQFDAVFFNTAGEVEDISLNWESSDDNIVAIDQEGLATAVTVGETHIIVRAGVVADSVMVTAGTVTVSGNANARTGTFVGLNNYNVSGEFSMELVGDNLVRLSFEDNFNVDNGPGLYVYLSNNENSVSGGIELGELQSNSGAQNYDFDQPDLFNAYSYVIIYCRPFGVPFGRGAFDN